MSNKKTKHPQTKIVTVKFTNGETLPIRMVYDRDVLTLNSDMFNHRAWQKDTQNISLQSSKAKQFQTKFGAKLFDK